MRFEDTKIGKKFNHLYEHGLSYWNGLNTLSLAIVGILFSLNREILWNKMHSNTLGWIIFIIIIASSIWYIVKQVTNSKTIESIEKEKKKEIESLNKDKKDLDVKIQKLENQISKINNNSIEIVEIHLAYLFEKIKLTNSERISLYKLINDEFFVLGRYSSNPELRKRSRPSYKKEGLIFKAWQEMKFFINTGIPKADDRRTKFRTGYYKYINEIAPIEEETALKIKMKSRSFFIKAFKDLQNLEQTSIIVIESKNEKAFEEQHIDATLNIDEERRLVAFVEKINWDFPNIKNASEIGF